MSLHEKRVSQPLSPLEELELPDHQIQQLQNSDQKHSVHQAEYQDSQLGTLNENSEQEEREEDKDRLLRQEAQAGAKINEREGNTEHAPHIAVSNTPGLSSHPLRSEEQVRVVNDSPQPVELAITADDSSEEIVMSPTTYPGQEWRPMYT
jgi:hypothetical protein